MLYSQTTKYINQSCKQPNRLDKYIAGLHHFRPHGSPLEIG